MADIIQANYESLRGVAKSFAQQSNAIRQLHSRLNRQVAQLRPAWVGRGSDAFFAEMTDKVLPAVQRLSAALAEADKVTKQIGEIMQNAEGEGAAPFESFASEGAGSGPGDDASGGLGDDASGGLGDDGAGDLADFGREIASIGNMSDSSFDELSSDNGFGDAGDFGDDAGGSATGGEGEFAVPDDWLDGVRDATGGETGGGSGGGETGGGSGGGQMGAGGGQMGGGSGMGQGLGSDANAAGQAGAAALPGPLRYAPSGSGGGGGMAAAAGQTWGGSAAGAVAQPHAAAANLGMPMGLAALAPLLALVGKAVKDRSSER